MRHFGNPAACFTFDGLEEYLLLHCPMIVGTAQVLPPNYPEDVAEFCNLRDAQVQAIAGRLRRRKSDDTAFCIAAFRWVRDEILYTLQPEWSVPVGHTLAIRHGMCSTKSCLLTSILRAGGLQAGFFVKEQNAAEAFLAPKWICEHYGSKSVHILSGVYLKGRWIKLNPYIDRYLGASMNEANLASGENFGFVVDFDGQSHALACSDCEMRFFDNIDFIMRKKSRVPPVVIQCHNICFEILRKFGSIFSSAENVLQAMEHHLMALYPSLVAEVVSLKSRGAGASKMVSMGNQRSKL